MAVPNLAGHANTICSSFRLSELNASVPRELVDLDASQDSNDAISELWQALGKCRADQKLLWRAHENFQQEMLKRFERVGTHLESHTMSALEQIVDFETNGQNERRCMNDNKLVVTPEFKTAAPTIGKAIDNSIYSNVETSIRYLEEDLHADSTSDVPVGYWGLRSSSWDAAIFLGHEGAFDIPEAIANFALLVINLVIQALFVRIVYSLSSSSLDDETIEAYKKWRANTAHATRFMDELTELTLAQRVCDTDPSLHLSDKQSAQVQAINEYIVDDFPFNGPMMCILAMLAWMLTVSRETHVLRDMLKACMNKRGGATVLLAERQRLRVQSLSIYRLLFVILLALWRAGIACTLLFIGIKYLIVTSSIEDILLNAVALEFILNIDELLFEALAPKKTRQFIVSIKPLPVTDSRAWRGLDLDFALSSIGILGMIAICVPLWLVPEIQGMRKAEEELCGGVRDFSYGLTALNTVIWAKTNSANEDAIWKHLQGTIRYEILQSVIDDQPSQDATNVQMSKVQGTLWSVNSMKSWDIMELGQRFNQPCLDFDTMTAAKDLPTVVLALHSLRDNLDDKSIATCLDVRAYCSHQYPPSVRLFCPVTCGCDSPSSSLTLPFAETGCPVSCLTSSKFLLDLETRACTDISKDVLTVSSDWMNLGANFIHSNPFPEGVLDPVVLQDINTLMLEYGCESIAMTINKYKHDYCGLGGFLKSLQFWCPETCKCGRYSGSRSMTNQCPRSCHNDIP